MLASLLASPAGAAGRPAGAARRAAAAAVGAGQLCASSAPPVSSRAAPRMRGVCRARHSPLVGGTAGDRDWKDALATLQVAKGEDDLDDDDDPPVVGWGAAFGDAGDDDAGGGGADVAASFDLDGPDGDEDEADGTIESSWGGMGDDDDEEDFEFIPDEPGTSTSSSRGGRGGGGRVGGVGGVVEEILFSLDDGWGLEALSAAEAAAEAAAGGSTASASTIQTGGRTRPPGRGRGSVHGDDDDGDGGGGGATPLHMRRLNPKSALASIPSHVLAALTAAQADAATAAAAVTPNALRRAAAERRTHRRLRIIGGASAGRRLLSGAGETTRPMMDKVRAALFDALSSGGPAGPGRLPPTSSWLDLFAGTGAVGLEALSRGAAAATFVEMDPWVVASVLRPNLDACGGDWAGDDSRPPPTPTPVQGRAEDFIARHPGPAFDYVSVCPPYEAVSYRDLLGGLAAAEGRILHPHTFVIVEYPRLASSDMPPRLGPLARLRDRKYGRTLVAIYGPE